MAPARHKAFGNLIRILSMEVHRDLDEPFQLFLPVRLRRGLCVNPAERVPTVFAPPTGRNKTRRFLTHRTAGRGVRRQAQRRVGFRTLRLLCSRRQVSKQLEHRQSANSADCSYSPEQPRERLPGSTYRRDRLTTSSAFEKLLPHRNVENPGVLHLQKTAKRMGRASGPAKKHRTSRGLSSMEDEPAACVGPPRCAAIAEIASPRWCARLTALAEHCEHTLQF